MSARDRLIEILDQKLLTGAEDVAEFLIEKGVFVPHEGDDEPLTQREAELRNRLKGLTKGEDELVAEIATLALRRIESDATLLNQLRREGVDDKFLELCAEHGVDPLSRDPTDQLREAGVSDNVLAGLFDPDDNAKATEVKFRQAKDNVRLMRRIIGDVLTSVSRIKPSDNYTAAAIGDILQAFQHHAPHVSLTAPTYVERREAELEDEAEAGEAA